METVLQTLTNGVILGANYRKEEFFNPKFENSNKLNLVVSTQIRKEFVDFSIWEKLFVSNFYGKNENGIILEKPSNKKTKVEEIKLDINREFEKLCAIANDFAFFEIQTSNNKFLDRVFENSIKRLERSGEKHKIQEILENKQNIIANVAKKCAESQQAEYKHIVDLIKDLNFEPAFKVLMLRETLLHSYCQKIEDGKIKNYVEKRIQNQTLLGHLAFSEQVLNYIYHNVENYSCFSNLYFDAINSSRKSVIKANEISLENVNTFGKGEWIKFEGKPNNEKEYLNNATKLSSLVQNTPWCTKQLAVSQLEAGDFFVFVDTLGFPRIAVKTTGNSIDEVRGIKGGDAQEIEEEFRLVAIEFLEKNKDIKNGKDWLEREEWNKRLVGWKTKIENQTFKEEDVASCLKDFVNTDFNAHACFKNSNRQELIETMPKAKNLFGKVLKCQSEKILFGDYDFNGNYETCPYEVIIGNAKFFSCLTKDIGDLKYVFGDADFSSCGIVSLNNLTKIWGNANFSCSQVIDFGELKEIGENAYFGFSKITDLKNLEKIGGHAYFVNSKIETAPNLKNIEGEIYFNKEKFSNLPIFEQLAKIKKIEQTKSNPNSKKITKIKTKKYFLINLKNKKIDKNLINDDLLSNLNNLIEYKTETVEFDEKSVSLEDFKIKNDQFNF